MTAVSDITLQAIAFRILAFLIIAGVQGGILAGTAVLLGDKGPKYDGRLTFLPAEHTNLLGAVSAIIFGLGWIKPVAIDSHEFKIGRVGALFVILAGSVGLLITAALLDSLILLALTILPYSAGLSTTAFLRAATNLSIYFALLSLVPVPPLAGGLLLKALGVRVGQFPQGIFSMLLFVGVATGVVERLLDPVYKLLAPVILGQ